MSDLPEKIMARPIMGAQPQSGSVTHSLGPWAIDNPYGNATIYYRADIHEALQAENKRMREALESVSLVQDEIQKWAIEAGYTKTPRGRTLIAVSYTHLRAHETDS